jgi:hypothetical protein
MVLKRVGPVSCAKISGVLYAIMGLIFGAFLSLIALAGGMASAPAGATGMSGFGAFGTIMGVGAIVLLPIFYGVMGFVLTLVGAWLYNVVAGAVGGIEMDLQ